MAHGDPSFAQVGPKNSKKNQVGCGLGAKFGPNYVQCCEKVKKQVISLGFFHILLGITF